MLVMRRMMLAVSVAYGLWAAWACVIVLRDAHFAVGDRGRLALLIEMRRCGDFISRQCLDNVRETIASIGEPSLWTVLWRMRRFYAEFIVVPPAWLVAVVGISVASWCLILLRRRRQVRLSRVREAWISTGDPNRPFNIPAA